MDGECKRISDNVSLNGDKCAADEVLVTGANGYVGRNLMWNLLESNKKVVALVRGNENKSGVDRLFESLPSSYKEKFTQCLNSQQLKVYEGDTSKSFLNLPDETYHRICSSVIIILHCAAKVNHQYNYDELKDDNVKSVWNIATFALTGQLKSIHHISTDGILMILEGVKDDNIQASDCCLVDENNRKYRNTGGGYADGYNTSKWAAEIFLSRLKLFVADLFISVYRPTLLLSHSDSEIEGEVNVTDWLSRVTIAIIETKTAPPLRLTVNYLPALPVDIASKSIIAIVCDEIITNEPSKINVYHVVNPHCENDAVGIDKIIDWIMTFPECYDVVRPPQNTQHSDWFKNQFMLRFDELSKNTQRKISSAIVGLIENPTSTHSTGLVVGSNFLRATLKSLGLKMIDIDSVFPHFNERSIHTTISHLVHKKVILLPSY
jgi:thioester reductase-like protein